MQNPSAFKRLIGVIVAIVIFTAISSAAIFIINETPKATSYWEYRLSHISSEHVSASESLPAICFPFIVETGVEIDDKSRIFMLYDWVGTKDQYDECVEELLSRNTEEFERIDWTIPYDASYGRIPTFNDLGLPPECSTLFTEIEPDWQPPTWTRLFPFLATKEAHYRFDGTEEERELCSHIRMEDPTQPAQQSGLKIRPPN